MSEKDKDGWSTGHFVNLAKNLPSIEIDCSGWESDIPADQWSHGTFVNLARSLPAVEVDCSNWDREPAVWLELVVPFVPDTKPAAVARHTTALVNVATTAVPELGLTCDSGRTREEGDSVVLSLKPRA